MTEILLLTISVLAGFLGAILGIGGGMIVVPVLTLVLQIDIRYAIAASLISIVATSSGAAASFLRDRLTNLRLAVLLEIGTVSGAIIGFLIASKIESGMLFLLFGLFLLFSALMMFRKPQDIYTGDDHLWSRHLKLASSYPNEKGFIVHYKVAAVPTGLLVMTVAGVLSALLGIGSGLLKVLAMDGLMKLPLKVSSATSNFMIGVTAAASAGAYFVRGDVKPQIAAPVAIGILAGSWLGARVMVRMKPQRIRQIFVVLLILVSIQMMIRGVRG